MKYFKVFALTAFLFLGISFPSCDDGHNCNCPPETFFNVEGLELLFFQDSNLALPIMPSDSVGFNNGKYIHLDYLVDYHTQVMPQWDWSFSLINSAYACSCPYGAIRSKTEKLVNLSIITLNDFDNDHLANSDITDLFQFQGYFFEDEFQTDFANIPLTEYITNRTDKILDGEDIVLKLKKAPELNSAFKLKISMELSTGEIYEVESESIFITP